MKDKYGQVIKFNGQERLPEAWWSSFGPTPASHRAGYKGMCTGDHLDNKKDSYCWH